MTQRWQADVRLNDINGMETVVRVEVEAPNVEAAKERAKEQAIEEVEFTGEHVSLNAEVKDYDIRPL